MRLSTVVVLATLVLLVFGGASAFARPYRVYMCKTPTGGNAPVEGLQFTNASTGTLYWFGNDCGWRDEGKFGISLGREWRAAGQYVRATISSPVPIIGVETRQRVVLAAGNQADGWATPRFALMVGGTDESRIVDQCLWAWGCTGSTASTWWAPTSQSAVNDVTWEVVCAGSAGGGCAGPAAPGDAGVPRASADIDRLSFIMLDERAPVLGEISGTAWTGPIHEGVEALKLSPYDGYSGSGLSRLVVTLGGSVVRSLDFGDGGCRDQGNSPSEPDYLKFQPCPQASGSLELPIDTARVPDGLRELQVSVTDAAGNESRSSTKILIDNVKPPVSTSAPTLAGVQASGVRPGDALDASPGGWTGNGLSFAYRWQRYDASTWTDIAGATGSRYVVTKADVGKQLRVVVRATAQNESAEAPSAPTPVVQSGAVVQVASVAPSTADAEGGAPQLVVDREQRSVQVKHGAQIVVTGRLVDADARPIADAVVDVFEQVTVVGAPWQKISTVTTDSQGGYSFRPTTTGSRTLRFAYSATRQAGEYRATREVVISVLAGMEIRALRRTVPASGLIALRGRVRAKPLPAAGTWVEVQVLDAGIWRTVATRRTSKTGRWSFTHRVRRTANVTFAFRARLRQLADVPSIESKSATVKVRVR